MREEKTIETNVLAEQVLRIAESLKHKELCFLNNARATKDMHIFQESLCRPVNRYEGLEEPIAIILNDSQTRLSFTIKVSSGDNEAYIGYIEAKPVSGATQDRDWDSIDRELKMLVADTLIGK